MERWPNFLLVGAPKAGTTSLWEYLNNHPQVYFPEVKEPHYFSPTLPTDSYLLPIRDRKKYLKLFEGVKDEIAIGEASASYLWDPQSAKFIHDTIPNVRIIIMLRNPVERAFSAYLMFYSMNREKLSFGKVIRRNVNNDLVSFDREWILGPGFYSEEVKRYLDIFESNKVKIIIFEEFVKEAKKQIKEVLKFLGLNENAPINVEKTFNPYGEARWSFAKTVLGSPTFSRTIIKYVRPKTRTKLRRYILKEATKPKLLEEDRLFLEDHYYDDVKKLEKILGRKLPWFFVSKEDKITNSN